jgi:RNA polymerase sigma factor (sigma-70 family)
MNAAMLRTVLRGASAGQRTGRTDGELLECFCRHRDEAAFEELLRRHGPMVRSVCRRMLGQSADADDAFQATFLVLVRKPHAICRRELLADWLCAVAYRCARQLRRLRSRRAGREIPLGLSPEPAASDDPPRDWLPLFDAALQSLPARYRAVVILCELQGLARSEAARRLGLCEGTLSSRLARARRLLLRRLAHRGFPLALGTALAPTIVPEALAAVTRRHAVTLALPAGRIPEPILQLTGAVMRETLLRRIRLGFVTLVVLIASSPLAWRAAGTGSARAGNPDEPPPRSAVPQQPPPIADPRQPVAIIHGDIKLTRAEYAEYLLRCFGSEKLQGFVNFRIIEMAAAAQGIAVTDAEVEESLTQDLASMNIDRATFTGKVLKQYGKSPSEWELTVLRPRLLLQKLIGKKVMVTDEELRREFENQFGSTVRCRMLTWPAAQGSAARRTAEVIAAHPAKFDSFAATVQVQEVTFRRWADDDADQKAADAAFRLKPGEVSAPLESRGSVLLLKCLEHIPADPARRMDAESARIRSVVLRRKVDNEIARGAQALLADARPQLLWK